jgi:uroporphyrinogen III methyltransferase/synthase
MSPCAVIEWGTWPRQRTVMGTLRTIVRRTTQAGLRPPAVFVVGDVVRLRKRLQWFERRPLFGRRMLVTRASEKAGSLSSKLEALGAEVEELPAIELVAVAQNGLFKQALRALPKTDWVFFTSPEGIGWLSQMLKPHRKDVRWLSGCHIGAIGSKTAAAIEAAGLHVDFVPKQFSQEGLLEELPDRVLTGRRALIFSAEGSRDVLAAGLRARGMRVTRVPVYRTVVPKRLTDRIDQVFEQPFDFVTVTSASCVDHLFEGLREAGKVALFSRQRFASIGPVTSQAIRAHRGRVAVQATVSTIEGLVEAIVRAGRHR